MMTKQERFEARVRNESTHHAKNTVATAVLKALKVAEFPYSLHKIDDTEISVTVPSAIGALDVRIKVSLKR